MEAVDGYNMGTTCMMYAVSTDGENNDHVMITCVINNTVCSRSISL